MARVLMIADAACHTGFATVTHNVGERLIRDYGHDVSVLATNHRGDHWDTPLKLYIPTLIHSGDIYGQSRFVELLAELMPEVVWILNDPQIILNFLIANQYDTQRVLLQFPKIMYLPIDGYNNPPAWEALARAGTRVAMSKFGQESMPGSDLILHGVDKAFSPMNKTAAKRALGYDPDRFLILRADKNSIRKNYSDTWRAVAPLLRKYKNIDVHFHCRSATPESNLRAFISKDEDIRDRANFSPDIGGFTGWDVDALRTLYSAADLYVSTSMGEGFGLTIAEALACGTPVVANGASAITEVVGPGGTTVPPIRPFAAPMGQDQMLPDVAGITAAIEHLYQDKKTRRSLGEAGRAHVLTHFDWDVAAARFSELIEKSAAGFSPAAIQTSIRSSSDGRMPEGSPA